MDTIPFISGSQALPASVSVERVDTTTVNVRCDDGECAGAVITVQEIQDNTVLFDGTMVKSLSGDGVATFPGLKENRHYCISAYFVKNSTNGILEATRLWRVETSPISIDDSIPTIVTIVVPVIIGIVCLVIILSSSSLYYRKLTLYNNCYYSCNYNTILKAIVREKEGQYFHKMETYHLKMANLKSYMTEILQKAHSHLKMATEIVNLI